jgi:hypothetical protein
MPPGYVEGVFANAERIVYAGETVSLRVSSSVPYQMTVVQLGSNTDQPSSTDVPPRQVSIPELPKYSNIPSLPALT